VIDDPVPQRRQLLSEIAAAVDLWREAKASAASAAVEASTTPDEYGATLRLERLLERYRDLAEVEAAISRLGL
jgi:hypothetical protein